MRKLVGKARIKPLRVFSACMIIPLLDFFARPYEAGYCHVWSGIFAARDGASTNSKTSGSYRIIQEMVDMLYADGK
jgi:hypothetical protein